MGKKQINTFNNPINFFLFICEEMAVQKFMPYSWKSLATKKKSSLETYDIEEFVETK